MHFQGLQARQRSWLEGKKSLVTIGIACLTSDTAREHTHAHTVARHLVVKMTGGIKAAIYPKLLTLLDVNVSPQPKVSFAVMSVLTVAS